MELNAQKMEDFQRKYYIFLVVLGIAFLLVSVRLWQLQVINGSDYKRLSENNRIRLLDTRADRGMLLDQKGEILAHNRPSFEVFAVPEDLKGNPEVLAAVGHILKISPADIQEKMRSQKQRAPFQPVRIKTDIDWNELALLESNRVHLPGVYLDVHSRRAYNYGHLASHLIGYMGELDETEIKRSTLSYRMGATVGKFGVEQQWEAELRGIDGGRQVEVDALGREIRELRKVDAFPGDNVFLTIDAELQAVAEEALQEHNGAIVAMDPKTGRILAMVSKPSYDPSLFAGNVPKELWTALAENPDHPLQNRCVQGLYPPGSVFKIVTAIAGLESGLLTPKTTFFCAGLYPYGNRDFRCWKEGGHGTIDLRQAIVSSCDIYFYQAGLRVGVDRIAQYAKELGLGRKTGIPFPNEKQGIVPSSSWKLKSLGVPWYSGETLSLAVGQGYITATPLQLAVLISAVANGGKIYRPQVVDRIEDLYGQVLAEYHSEQMGEAKISQGTLDFIRDALRGAVNEPGGTGGGSALKEFVVAGKTGTAQVIRLPKDFKRGDSMPVRFRDHAWFAAFAPFDDPKIAVVVLTEHGGFGGAVSAPIAKKVIQKYLAPESPSPLKMTEHPMGSQETGTQ